MKTMNISRSLRVSKETEESEQVVSETTVNRENSTT